MMVEPVHVSSSYAVSWRDRAGRALSGKLALGPDRLRLEGAGRDGLPVVRELPYAEIAAVRVGRTRGERIDGRSTVVIEPRGAGEVVLTSAVGLGTVQEIAERLGALSESLPR